MLHSRLALALAFSVLLASCGGEESPASTSPADLPAEGGSGSEEVAPASQDPVGDVVEAAEELAGDAVARADSLLEEITSYLADHKIDLAQTALDQLVALQDKLPASYQDRIAQARSLIDAAGLGDQAKKLTEGLGLGGD
jgi:hypothetical protein